MLDLRWLNDVVEWGLIFFFPIIYLLMKNNLLGLGRILFIDIKICREFYFPFLINLEYLFLIDDIFISFFKIINNSPLPVSWVLNAPKICRFFLISWKLIHLLSIQAIYIFCRYLLVLKIFRICITIFERMK